MTNTARSELAKWDVAIDAAMHAAPKSFCHDGPMCVVMYHLLSARLVMQGRANEQHRLTKDGHSQADKIDIGNRISAARKAIGISQQILAKKISHEISSVTKIERGIRKPRASTLLALSRALNVTIDYLLYGREFDWGQPATPQDKSDRTGSPSGSNVSPTAQ